MTDWSHRRGLARIHAETPPTTHATWFAWACPTICFPRPQSPMRVMSTASDGDGRRENVKTMSRKPAAKQYFRVCHLEASREGWTGLQAADNADTSSAPCLTSPSHGLVSVRRHAGLSARRRMRDCVHDAASIYSRMQAMHAFSVRWLALAGAFGLHGIDDRMPAGIGEFLISSVSPGSKQRVSGGIASFVPPFPATSPCGVPLMQCLPDGVWAQWIRGDCRFGDERRP